MGMKASADQRARRLVKARKEHDRETIRAERQKIVDLLKAECETPKYIWEQSKEYRTGFEAAIGIVEDALKHVGRS